MLLWLQCLRRVTVSIMNGSYRYQLVNLPPDDVVCPICLDILVEPNLLTCCGQHLCKECGTRISKVCPLCRDKKYQVVPDKYFERNTLNRLQVYCEEKSEGCPMKGDLYKLLPHMKDCGYKHKECPLKCGKSYQRRSIKSHTKNDCPKRSYKCKYCDHTSTYENITEVHMPICDAPVLCPNECSLDTIAKEELSSHIEKHCPLQVVPCDFDTVCSVTMPRKDLSQHLTEYAQQHIAMTTKKTNEELLKVLKEKERETAKKERQLIKILEEKDQQIRDKDQQLREKDKQIREKDQQFKEKDEQMKEKDEQVKEKDRQIKLLMEQRLDIVLMSQNNKIEMKEFSEKQGHWFSLPYYLHGGYKMCFEVDVESFTFEYVHKQNYYIMRGPFDDALEWPFNGSRRASNRSKWRQSSS